MSAESLASPQIPYMSEWRQILKAGIEGDQDRALRYSALLVEKMRLDGHADAENIASYREELLGLKPVTYVVPMSGPDLH